jgi:hypothetical protein
MDEKRMFQLIKAAAELEELHAAVEGRPPEPVSPVRPRRRRRWLLLAAPLAAAALALIFRPPALHLEEITVKRVPVRSAETELEVTLRWNRPARVRLVVIDEKNEPWIIPIGEADQYVSAADTEFHLRVPSPHSQGAVPRVPKYVVVVASAGPAPDAGELLRQLPDPVAPLSADHTSVRAALERLASQVSAAFDCTVHVKNVPD